MICLLHHLVYAVVVVIVVTKDHLCANIQDVESHLHVHTISHHICVHILQKDHSHVDNVDVDLLVNMIVTDMKSCIGALSHLLVLLVANPLHEWMR